MLLPITFFSLEPVAALIMLAGIYYGAQYGGSTTAILINPPGETSAAVTAIDGHEMALKGRAGPALAAAALGSFFAGTVGTVVLAVATTGPRRAQVRPRGVLLARRARVARIDRAGAGLDPEGSGDDRPGDPAGTAVGQDIYTGTPRFVFGVRELYGGINFVSVAVGMLGVAEILRNLEDEQTRTVVVEKVKNLWPTRRTRAAWWLLVLRATGLGSALGILPGGGHVLAAFASYSVEKRVSKRPQEFGHGAIEGVAGPESANNAAAQTSFIPLLTLGLPAHPVMALMIGAFIIQGITPGPDVITEQPALVWGLIASMWSATSCS